MIGRAVALAHWLVLLQVVSDRDQAENHQRGQQDKQKAPKGPNGNIVLPTPRFKIE